MWVLVVAQLPILERRLFSLAPLLPPVSYRRILGAGDWPARGVP